jgi:hypothetical protein
MQSPWPEVIAAAAAILGVVLGFLLNNWSRRSEKREERIERVRFNIYRLLIDLESYHFFIASFDMRGEESPVAARKGFEHINSKIYDQLLVYDGLKESEDIVRVLSSYSYATEMDRRRNIRRLVESLAKQISPNLQKMLKTIDEENEMVAERSSDESLKRVRKLQV